jgi:hypothetical protein
MSSHAAPTRRAYRRTRFDFDPRGEGVFGATASEIARFAATTRPAPSNEVVEAHVRWLIRQGLIAPAEVRALRRRGFQV